MNHKIIALAGWLAMVSAFASIPLAYLAFKLEGSTEQTATLGLLMIQVVGLLLFVAITLLLKKILNHVFSFHQTDRSIELMILANVVATVCVIGGMFFPPFRDSAGMAALVLMVFEGVVQIRFGYQLLKLPSSLGGLHKPFCYLNIATGICEASVVLVLAGVVVSAISDLMLATIFFNVLTCLKTADQAGKTALDK